MGIFFKDYESAGSGIAKNAPKKEGIALFLDLLGRKFWNLMLVNLLYYIFFIPLMLIFPAFSFIRNSRAFLITAGFLVLVFMFTIGPATAGLTKVIRCFCLEKHTFIARDFFNGFKVNFKKGMVVGLIDCLILISSYAALSVYPYLAVNMGTRLMYVPMVITFSLFLVVMIMNFYIFPMMVATQLSFKDLLKNSFALAFAAIKENLISFVVMILLTAVMAILFMFATPLFLLILPFFPSAFIAFVICFNCYPVIQKYVINPYYTSIGEVNPELLDPADDIEGEKVFEDMGGKEMPIKKRSKGKGRRIS